MPAAAPRGMKTWLLAAGLSYMAWGAVFGFLPHDWTGAAYAAAAADPLRRWPLILVSAWPTTFFASSSFVPPGART